LLENFLCMCIHSMISPSSLGSSSQSQSSSTLRINNLLEEGNPHRFFRLTQLFKPSRCCCISSWIKSLCTSEGLTCKAMDNCEDSCSVSTANRQDWETIAFQSEWESLFLLFVLNIAHFFLSEKTFFIKTMILKREREVM
jgi:hypothetical protein